MIISQVKKQGEFFVINGKTIPNDPQNSDFKEIEKWVAGGGVVDPEFTTSELLEEARALKISELKNHRDSRICKPTPQTISYDGVLSNKSFNFSEKDVSKVGLVISFLEDAEEGTTRKWTDASGNRLDLTLANFKSLRNHYLTDRDGLEYDLYAKRKAEVKASSDIKFVEKYDITKTDFD